MATGITIDATAFNKTVKDLVNAVDKDSKTVLLDEMRLLTQRLVDLTPPFTGRGKGNAGKRQGEAAVESDINRMYYTDKELLEYIKADKMKKTVRRLLRNGRFDELKKLFEALSPLLARSQFVSRASKESHNSQRNSRGRVFRNPAIHFIPNASSLKSYIKEVKTHVGKAKGGWMRAVNMFKVKLVPKWVSRHENLGEGHATQRPIRGGMILEAINRNKAIVSLNTTVRILSQAMATRERDMRTKIEKALNSRAK